MRGEVRQGLRVTLVSPNPTSNLSSCLFLAMYYMGPRLEWGLENQKYLPLVPSRTILVVCFCNSGGNGSSSGSSRGRRSNSSSCFIWIGSGVNNSAFPGAIEPRPPLMHVHVSSPVYHCMNIWRSNAMTRATRIGDLLAWNVM